MLVNTIGSFRPEDVFATTPEMLRLMLDVDLGPALWLTQAAAPYMQQQGSGAIVQWPPVDRRRVAFLVSDAAAPVSGPIVPAYGA